MSETRWTPEQLAAIRSSDDTLLVANAGTGKTTTVIGKILWLLGISPGVDPVSDAPMAACAEPCGLAEIAAITFTEKAAYDLKRKLREAIATSDRAEELRWQLDRAAIGTIHSFCGTLLREHALRLNIDPTFRVLDENEAWAAQDEIIRDLVMRRLEGGDTDVQGLLERVRLVGREHNPGLIDQVRRVVRDLRWHRVRYAAWSTQGRLDRELLGRRAAIWDNGDEASFASTAALVALASEACADWQRRLAADNARDFDALVLDVLELLRGDTDPEGSNASAALAGIRRRYRILVVDEFQDTDAAQRDIVFAIGLGVPRPQLFLVGDPKQSIYRFRGADVAVWNSVEEVLRRQGSVLPLSTNFRCDRGIVRFVNSVGHASIGATAAALAQESAASSVEYTELVAAVPARQHAGIEWLDPGQGKVDEIRAREARMVVECMRRLLDGTGGLVTDPESGEIRPCRASDIAVLYRNRTGLDHLEGALAAARIPYWLAGTPHLGQRQEVLDLVNALRLLRNPGDDLRALGFLRSPFVCLRDEVIARLRLAHPGESLLAAASRELDGEPFAAPEHPRLHEIEQAALESALRALEIARRLAPRLPLDELLEEFLDRTGYRLHLLLTEHAEEALANIQSFVQFAGGYRDLGVDAFLEIWDRWSSQDLGIPQAPLYSGLDEVVTLTTVHAAKGLEWPVVFLIGLDKGRWRDPGTGFVSDRDLGPVLSARQQERGARNRRIVQRDHLEADAEEARLTYVAVTRARDRLVLAGPRDKANSYGEWLQAGVTTAPVKVSTAIPPPVPPAASTGPSLEWLDRLEFRSPGDLVGPLSPPPLRFVLSATELMVKARDPERHRLRFVHGVAGRREFVGLPRAGLSSATQLPSTVRGTLIHEVLERIREADELSRILEETIGGLDDPELERLVGAGSEARRLLEEEIAGVVDSPEWSWYVCGPHWRELPFAHLVGARAWRIGAFDLYRPNTPAALIIDFKTHQIDAEQVPATAGNYAIQARLYREAAAVRGPSVVRLHFTGPNVVVQMPDPVTAGDDDIDGGGCPPG